MFFIINFTQDMKEEGEIFRDHEDNAKNEKQVNENPENQDKYFDGERYYDAEEFFNVDEETDLESEPQTSRKWIKVTVSAILAIVLVSNILAFWPQVYNLAAIKFLRKSHELSKNADVQGYKQAIVVVSAADRKGTGFNIAADGLIVTNHHVIKGEKFVFVHFENGERYQAEVVVTDPSIDIAILKINDEDLDLPSLAIEYNEEANTNIPVYVIGNPLSFDFIVNEGTILGLIQLDDWDIPVLMIGAPIYKGNSGSPVINHDGNVVGIAFATTKVKHGGSTKKVGLAVPVDDFKKYLDFDVSLNEEQVNSKS
jgi:serine protease Do